MRLKMSPQITKNHKNAVGEKCAQKNRANLMENSFAVYVQDMVYCVKNLYKLWLIQISGLLRYLKEIVFS